jgi:dTDP-4-dehydrorhamnose 3,5-epimerase
MKFTETDLAGVWMIDLEPIEDERGFFARTYCEREFAAYGLNTRWPQSNLSKTLRAGMLRGLHFQAEPLPEIKLIRCAAGAIHDVLVDVRPESPSYGQWQAFELTGENRTLLYVPGGYAHGFQSLTDNTEVFYQMSTFYVADLARGIRWDDPDLAIRWPIPNPFLSERDRSLPTLNEAER